LRDKHVRRSLLTVSHGWQKTSKERYSVFHTDQGADFR